MSIHKLRALEYLVAVVEHGSYSAAARKLGVAVPSVHRLVKALEGELRLPLLDRAASPLRPTPDAEAYVERARQLLAELQGLESGLLDHSGAPRGTLTVAAQSVVLQFVVGELLSRFHARYPQVNVDLVDAGTTRDLAQLGTDVLLQFGWPPPQDASLRTLADTRWLVVATPGYWSAHGVPSHPSELSAHPCVLFRTPYGEVIKKWSFVREGTTVDVEVAGWLTGDHRGALDAPVYGGQVVARINDLTATHGIRNGSLRAVLLDWTGLHAPPLTLLIRRSVARQPRVRAWVSFLADEIETMIRNRVPPGLPPVQTSKKPEWFKKRVH